ncbi:MAG: hypothetical protein RJA25_182 [Bacteroidota bacterium]|jgi:hypothetical protein
MGAISFSIPKELVLNLLNDYKIKNFVETGTFKGNSSIWAAHHFEKVYTIEIDAAIHQEASSRPDAKRNISFILGNSKEKMPEIVANLKGTTLFWLDGHWCVGAGGKEHECPLEDELIAISKLEEESVILIDDARCFLGKLPPPHHSEDWPTTDEVFKLFFTYFPSYNVTIIQDVIVVVPKNMQPTIDAYWKKNFYSFYSDKTIINKYSLFKILKMKLSNLLSK